MGGNQQSLSPRCGLLELPAELRCSIYKYTVIHKRGLTVRFDESKPRIPVYARGEEQQATTDTHPLMLVCRQLHNETKDLIFEANSEINLYGMKFRTPSSYVLSAFTRRLKFVAVSNLRKIAVSGGLGTTERLKYTQITSYFDSFKPFCAAHPHIRVILRFGFVEDINEATWPSECISLKALVRGECSIRNPAQLSPADVDHVRIKLSYSFHNFRSLPDNLRFSIMDEALVRGLRKTVRPLVKEDWFEGVAADIKEIWEEGI